VDELGEEPGDPGDNPGEPGDDDGERLNDDDDDDEEDEGGAYLATVSSTSTASSVNAVSSCSPHPQPSYQTTAVNKYVGQHYTVGPRVVQPTMRIARRCTVLLLPRALPWDRQTDRRAVHRR